MVRNKLLLILGLILFTSNVKAQVINYVKYEYQADIKVYFVNYKYEADIIIFKTKYKQQSQHPGYWYMGEKNDGDNNNNNSSNKLNVYVVKYKYQSDYNVYIGKYEYEIKLNDEYLNEIKW